MTQVLVDLELTMTSVTKQDTVVDPATPMDNVAVTLVEADVAVEMSTFDANPTGTPVGNGVGVGLGTKAH